MAYSADLSALWQFADHPERGLAPPDDTAPGPTFTITRNSPGYYTRSDGLLAVAPAAPNTSTNQDTAPRFEYHPVTLAIRGLLVERSSTNELMYSNQLTNAAWVSSGPAVAVSALSSVLVVGDCFDLENDAGQVSVTQARGGAVSIGTNRYTYSIYIRKPASDPGWISRIYFELTGGSETVAVAMFVNPFTGAIDAASGIITGTAITYYTSRMEQQGPDWWRASITFEDDSGASDWTAGINPVWGPDGSAPGGTPGTLGTLTVACAQLEQQAHWTSWIDTDGTVPLTRQADVISTTDMSFWTDGAPQTYYTDQEWYDEGLNGALNISAITSGLDGGFDSIALRPYAQFAYVVIGAFGNNSSINNVDPFVTDGPVITALGSQSGNSRAYANGDPGSIATGTDAAASKNSLGVFVSLGVNASNRNLGGWCREIRTYSQRRADTGTGSLDELSRGLIPEEPDAGPATITGTAANTEAADTSVGVGAVVAPGVVTGTAANTEDTDTSIGTGVLVEAKTVSAVGANLEAADSSAGLSSIIAVTVVEPEDNRVFQRVGSTYDLVLSGTYTGAADTVEARLVQDGTSTPVPGFDWAIIDNFLTGNTWTGTLSAVPEGGWYNVQVRVTGAPTATDNGSNQFGVGMIVAVIGGSNASAWFTSGTALTADPLLRKYDGSYLDIGANGDGVKSFGNTLAANMATPVPVMFMDYGVDDSALLSEVDAGASFWLSASGGQPYPVFASAVSAVGGAFESVVWIQGERDARSGTVTQTEYQNGLSTLISNIRADFINGSNKSAIPVLVSRLGRGTNVADTDASFQDIRDAEDQVSLLVTEVYANEAYDLALADEVVYTSAAFATHGERMAQSQLVVLGDEAQYRGPVLQQWSRTDAEVTATVGYNFGTDFTGGTTGWLFTDDGTPIAIINVTKNSSTEIVLTLASTPVGTTQELSYAYGKNPDVSDVFRDNSVLSLPLYSVEAATEVEEPTGSVSPYLSLWWQPAASCGNPNEETLTSTPVNGFDTITFDFTGNNNGAPYYDSNGVLQNNTADNQPRFDHKPISGTPIGLFQETLYDEKTKNVWVPPGGYTYSPADIPPWFDNTKGVFFIKFWMPLPISTTWLNLAPVLFSFQEVNETTLTSRTSWWRMTIGSASNPLFNAQIRHTGSFWPIVQTNPVNFKDVTEAAGGDGSFWLVAHSWKNTGPLGVDSTQDLWVGTPQSDLGNGLGEGWYVGSENPASNNGAKVIGPTLLSVPESHDLVNTGQPESFHIMDVRYYNEYMPDIDPDFMRDLTSGRLTECIVAPPGAAFYRMLV
jgi:hypothetical protein